MLIIISDFEGKLCYNGGTLNTNTGRCSCTDLYEGDNCERSELDLVTVK